MLKLLIYYLLLMNALGMILMITDKSRARKKMRRISEANIFMIAVMGGSPAIIFSMLYLRHKNRKKKFSVGLPLILTAQILCGLYLIFT